MTHPINNFRARLRGISPRRMFDVFHTEISEQNGTWKTTENGRIRICVHGVEGRGISDIEAMIGWINASMFHPASVQKPELQVH